MGGADPMYGSLYDHNSMPVSESNALINLSSVPAAKTSPPRVAVAPPKFSVPVIIPLDFKTS